MGCLNRKGLPNLEEPSDTENNLVQNEGELERVPNYEFICECGHILEVKNINVNTGKIDFFCMECGKKNISFDDCSCKINYSLKCENNNCKNESNDIYYYYCYECQKNLCNLCQESHENHYFIKYDKEKNEYQKNFNYFCLDCDENVCEKELNKYHKDHNVKDLTELHKDFLIYRKKIIQKNRDLSILIRFNQLIVKSYEENQYNYFFLKTIGNIGKSIEKENLDYYLIQ